jgi:hypothetical protein
MKDRAVVRTHPLDAPFRPRSIAVVGASESFPGLLGSETNDGLHEH